MLEDYEQSDETRSDRRTHKKDRRVRPLRESKDARGNKDTRRARQVQRAMRRGEYDFGLKNEEEE